MILFQVDYKKGKAQSQETGVYRFNIGTLETLNISGGFDGDLRMHPDYLRKAEGWIKKNGKKLENGNWSVDAKLLQPGDTKDKNSLYNFALKEFPKSGAKGAGDFCKDILQMVMEADSIWKATQKKQGSEFIKSA